MNNGLKVDFKRLRAVCGASLKSFGRLGDVVGVEGRESVFIRRGGSLLAVAHLDFVELPYHFGKVNLSDGLTVFCPRLDDRLGVYAILDLLPVLVGDSCFDVLLTSCEESGSSSASDFKLPDGVSYNWVFSLDRRGRDCVTYGVDSKKWRGALGRAGWSIGLGSYSDISELDSLGVCAVNFGVGYESEHTKLTRVNVPLFLSQVGKVARFIGVNSGKRFDYSGGGKIARAYKSSVYYSTYDYDDSYWSRWSGRGGAGAVKPVKAGAVAGGCYYCDDELVFDDEVESGVCRACMAWESRSDYRR